MGNKQPKEANMGSSLRCDRCNIVLPPCTSFDDFYQRVVDGRNQYVFNGGEYFRQRGYSQYFCNDCFFKKIWEREQNQREQEEEQRREKMSEKLQQSQQLADKQQEQQQLSRKSVEFERKQSVLKQRLDEFPTDEPEEFSDDLLEVLSSKCDMPITSFSQLTDDQLRQIMSAMDSLLFNDWIDARPPLQTLQHAQVLLTQLCTLTLETSEEASLQSVSQQVQSQVQTISESAANTYEHFLLTQALYLSLVHLFTEDDDSDAVHIAKQWAEGDLSAETLFVLNFLCTLTESLDDVAGMASVFVLRMEIQCLRLLFSTLTHLNGKESHMEVIKMHLRLAQINGWKPAEVLTLLKVFLKKNAEDASITKILTLIQVHDVSPAWTDDCERSVIEAIDFSGPKDFYTTFQQALKNKESSDLLERVVELMMHWNFDESVLHRVLNITNITSNSLQNPQNEIKVLKRDYKIEDMQDDDFQGILTQLCNAVFHTKGWWPSQSQIIWWCAAVLTEKSQPPKLVGFEQDPCVTAMIAAVQICMGNKLDIVLSSGALSEQETREWSDFYKVLGITFNTNRRNTNESYSDVYESDIVYGCIEEFVTDYIQYSFEVMEARRTQLIRGFILEKGCLSAGYNLKFSRLKNNEALGFVAEELQSVLGKIANQEMELRHSFLRVIFQVLHSDLKGNVDMKVMTLSQSLAGNKLSSQDVFVLIFLETLMNAIAVEAETMKNSNSPIVKSCFSSLLACAMQLQPSKSAKELLQMMSNLVTQKLWTPKEALTLIGSLTANHQDESFISIMKILHLMTTYQISSKWKDEKDQLLLPLIDSSGTQDLILHLKQSFKVEKIKSLDTLFDEIRAMKDIDEETLEKSYTMIKYVQDLKTNDEIKNHADADRARSLSGSMKTEDMQEVLAVLCNAVHNTILEGKWWPRGTQMASWCFLALDNNGKLLQMGTGEGKSIVVAMFAALRALRGEKVDVISSSSVLCQRDAEECADFYSYFGLTVDANTNKTKDTDRKKCYEKDIIYGTVETYAADHLRQTFEMKDVRPNRRYECIIIDEVDLLLLDQGIQVTYLSSPMVSMQHLNIILTMIWGHVCQYRILNKGYETFICGPHASFFKAVFDSMDTEDTEIDDPMDILQIAEDCNIVQKGFSEEIYKSDKDTILTKLKTVSQDAQINFFNEIEEYVPYGFTVYILDDSGSLSLKKHDANKQAIQNLKFLVLDDGLCCPLFDSEEILIDPIAEFISDQLHYTPSENNTKKINIPGFLKSLVEQKLPTWVQNAFLAMSLRKGQEYVVENEHIYPVDFKSTGIVELNKKWGEGLQQFVEIKHQIKISTMSAVTNYVSNLSFFEMYNGKIYGLTGTLGCKTDMMFLNEQYPNLSACEMPTFNRRKLFEEKGIIKNSTKEWNSEIKRVLLDKISRRAALVICETINKVNDLHEELKDSISGEVLIYARSDTSSLSVLSKKLNPGDVILATNLAGRGTNIKVTDEVNKNGGLFVILSFLPENERVQLQAFGRTARKGKPGSAQLIISTQHLQDCYREVSSLEEAKYMRDSLAVEKIQDMQKDIDQMELRDDLFLEYCETLQEIYKNTEKDEQKAIVAIMNEFWGIWLQTKSDEIDQLKRSELQNSLRADLASAKKLTESQNSPSSSIYHYVKFGNVALKEKKWDVSARLFEKASKTDASWAAIAFYNHSYCIIKMQSGDYLTQAKNELKKAQDSLKYFSEECLAGLSFVKLSLPKSDDEASSLENQFSNKCTMLSFLDKNINDAIKKLDEIKGKGRDALAKKAPVFTLVSDTDEDLQMETFNLYERGLKYVFSVEEEPRFPWEALLVFLLGIAQIIGGALLTAFTFGALANVGMGLITEGISDCITGIESMITGEFSWKSWAIDKAISIAVSLIGFGIGKLVSTGFKAAKLAMKGFGKSLKALPKFLASQAKQGFSATMKTNMKNAVKYTAKKIVQDTVMYGIGKAEDEIIKLILEKIKINVKKGILQEVKSNMAKDPLCSLTDAIILSHIESKQEFNEFIQDKIMKQSLLAIFTKLTTTALAPFSADLKWQNKLNASIIKVMDAVKKDSGEKMKAILTAIHVVHMEILAVDALAAVLSLSDKYFTGLKKGLEDFRSKVTDKVKTSDLSDSEKKALNAFRQTIVESISTLLANTLVEVFHQKFSSHLVNKIKGKINGVIGNHVKSSLNIKATIEQLKSGQAITHAAYKSGISSSSQQADSHAAKVKDPEYTGSEVDIRILSEAAGIKFVILTEGKDGKLTTMQEISPKKKDASQTLTLVYKSKSKEHPDGHYVPHIKSKTGSAKDLYHAIAQSTCKKTDASDDDIKVEADRLRADVLQVIEKNPSPWVSVIVRADWIKVVTVFLSKPGAGGSQDSVIQKKKDFENIVKEMSLKVKEHSNAKDKDGTLKISNGHIQPSKKIISIAKHFKKDSKLSKSMFKVATDSSDHVKLKLPVLYAPYERYNKYPTAESPEFKKLLAQTISKDDAEGTFKFSVLGAMPTLMLERNHFLNDEMSLTRLVSFEYSFPERAKEMVYTWLKLLEGKTDLMKSETVRSLEHWINTRRYLDLNDPFRKQLTM